MALEIPAMGTLIALWPSNISIMMLGTWITAILITLILVREGLIATEKYTGRKKYIDFVIVPSFIVFIVLIGYRMFVP